MTSIDDTVSVLIPHFEQFINVANLECEVRLGFKEKTGFDPNVGKLFFDRIDKVLSSSEVFVLTETKIVDVFVGGNRTTTMPDGSSVTIKKSKLRTIDFGIDNTPFDCRISLSKEEPVTSTDDWRKGSSDNNIVRNKHRKSYNYKDKVKYDLTVVSCIKNTVEMISYEVEIEVLKFDDTTILGLLMKTIDLCKMCEDVDKSEIFFRLLSTV